MKFFVTLTAIFFLSLLTQAHPHVFIDLGADFLFEDTTLKGIRILWLQQDPFGGSLEKVSDAKYKAMVKKTFIDKIAKEDFFCQLFVNGKLLSKLNIHLKKIKFDRKQGTLDTTFVINTDIKCRDLPTTIDLLFYDSSNYVAFMWSESDIILPPNKKLTFKPTAILNDETLLRLEIMPEGANLLSTPPLPIPIVSLTGGLYQKLIALQAVWHKKIFNNIRALKNDFGLKLFLCFFAVAFAFGCLHALGPGHGKIILISYSLDSTRTKWEVIKASCLIGLSHTGIALLLSVIFVFFMTYVSPAARPAIQGTISFTAAVLLTLCGIIMTFVKFRSKSSAEILNGKIAIWLAGLFPCPQSILIMLTCFALKIPMLGLVAISGIALGTVAVLMSTGFFVHQTQNRINKTFEHSPRKKFYFETTLDFLRITGITFAGVFMMILYWPT